MAEGCSLPSPFHVNDDDSPFFWLKNFTFICVAAESRVRHGVSPCRICDGLNGTGKTFLPGCLVFSCQDHSINIRDHISLTIDVVWLYHLTGYLNKTSKISFSDKRVKIFANIMVRCSNLVTLNMNMLAEKGLLISLLGWRFSQRLYWSSRFKIIIIIIIIIILWQPLQFGVYFCMNSRVKDVFLYSGLQCGHSLYIST